MGGNGEFTIKVDLFTIFIDLDIYFDIFAGVAHVLDLERLVVDLLNTRVLLVVDRGLRVAFYRRNFIQLIQLFRVNGSVIILFDIAVLHFDFFCLLLLLLLRLGYVD